MKNLLDETRRLFDERTESMPTLAIKTGLGYHWLAKFSQDQIPDPGVRKVQTLYDYLHKQTQTR